MMNKLQLTITSIILSRSKYWLLASGFLLSIYSNAQVTVGDSIKPKNFSVMEISTENVEGGLRLPQLTTVQRNALNVLAGSAAQGLMIYNIDTNCVEYWDGYRWASQCYDSNPENIPTGVGSFTGQTTFDIAFGNNEAGGCGPIADRTRKKTIFSDRSGGVGSGVQTYTFKPASAVSRVHFEYVDVEGNVIEKITPEADYSIQTNITTDCKVIVDFYQTLDGDLRGLTYKNGLIADLYVIYNDAPLGGGVERKLKLTLFLTDCACGARDASGNWLNFMCHNLGADHTLNPFSYVVGNADGSGGTLGYLYQWGRPAVVDGYGDTGYQKRNSATTTTTANNNEGTSPSVVIGKFIINENFATSLNWQIPTNNLLWGNGTQDVNPPKGVNDPCPTGWKVPSRMQWTSIYAAGNTPVNPVAPGSATSNNWVWTDNGFKVGNALFLPAAGFREVDGIIRHVSTFGYYWSSTIFSVVNASNFAITNNNLIYSNGPHAGAESIRCIEE